MRPSCHRPYLAVHLGTAVLFSAGLAVAQFNCSIQGIATDPSGAVVPDATVQVTNVETGIKRDAKTSSEGLYRVISLGPGTYQVDVTAKGFRSMTRTGIVVGITETARIDFTLQVGGCDRIRDRDRKGGHFQCLHTASN